MREESYKKLGGKLRNAVNPVSLVNLQSIAHPLETNMYSTTDILETIASDTPANVRPWLAILFARASGYYGFDASEPNLFGRFATALWPDGPDDRMRAVARVIDVLWGQADRTTDEFMTHWHALETVGVADDVQAALDAYPRAFQRLLNVARAPAMQRAARLQ